jgi:AcrR family transcriptional regulator
MPSDQPDSSRNKVTRTGRPRDEARRESLRDAAVEVLLERGLFGVSLEDLGRSVGASGRMLVYHFGSKDGLLKAALEEARRQQIAAAREHLASATISDLTDLLRAIWDFLRAPSIQPYLRLFSEVAALSAQEPTRFPGFAYASVHDWLPDLEIAMEAAGHDPSSARSLATIAFAIERGLLLDRMATGERERVEVAHDFLLRLIR